MKTLLLNALLFSLVLVAVIMWPAASVAADKDGVSQGFALGAPGCFEYMLTPDKVLIVNTAAQLLIDKEHVVVSGRAEIQPTPPKVSVCTPEGEALYGRLMKIGPVASVRIAARSFAVTVQPFPPNVWDATLPLVLKEIKETLDCKK